MDLSFPAIVVAVLVRNATEGIPLSSVIPIERRNPSELNGSVELKRTG